MPACERSQIEKQRNVRFYPTAGAAQYAGFRTCKRCLPDAVPGFPEWDVAARGMRLISDGVVDQKGVSGLTRRLGYTGRHLHRLLVAELGAGPLALARTRRAHTARLLLEATNLPVTGVAFAAGFSSIRQFNETVRSVFAATPGELRRTGRRAGPSGVVDGGEIELRLPYREPFDAGSLLGFLGARAVLGQQVSVAGAGTLAGRLVDLRGEALREALAELDGGLTHLFPGPASVVGLGAGGIGLLAARHRALVGLARALELGELTLDPGADRDEAHRRLLALQGIGPWTASYVAMRALGDPDAFLPTDLGVRKALARLGHPDDPGSVEALAEGWRPWRSYAVQHLWAGLEDEPTQQRELREETVA